MSFITNTSPAERERGCVWADIFDSAAEVIKNNGEIFGTPTFEAGQGVTLDGTSDYLSYDVPVGLLDSDEISVVIEFTPDFEADDDIIHRIISTTDTTYSIYKHSSAGGNRLNVLINGVSVFSLTLASYQQYWKVGEKNCLVFSGTSGDGGLFMNGINLASSSSAWTKATISDIYVGIAHNATGFFDGTIHSVKFFNEKITDQEAEDYSNGGGFWNYENEALMILPMDFAAHDPSVKGAGGFTLDKFVNHDANWGDSSTLSTFPTKLTESRGYSLDGVDEYFTIDDADDLSFGDGTTDSPFTLWAWVKMDDPVGFIAFSKGIINTDFEYLLQGDGEGRLFLALGDNSVTDCYLGAKTVDNLVPYTGQWILVASTYDGSGVWTGITNYVNGESMTTSDESNGAYVAMEPLSADLLIGRYDTDYADGDVAICGIIDKELTPMQVADLYQNTKFLMGKV